MDVHIHAVAADGTQYPVRLETWQPPRPRKLKGNGKGPIKNSVPGLPPLPRPVITLAGLAGTIGAGVPLRVTGPEAAAIEIGYELVGMGYLFVSVNGRRAALPPQDELVAPLFAADLTGRALAALGQLRKITEPADRHHVEAIRDWRKRQAEGRTAPAWGLWCEWSLTVYKQALTVLYAPGLPSIPPTRDRIELHGAGEPHIHFVEERGEGSLEAYVAALAESVLAPKKGRKKKEG